MNDIFFSGMEKRRLRLKAKRRRSYLKNRDIEIARAKDYAKAHPEKVLQWKRESRARHGAKWTATRKAKLEAAKLATV